MLKRILVLFACALSLHCFATGFEPQPGLWWNPAESGRGYSIDPQGDTMVVLSFAYDENGRMQWYISSGPMTNFGQHFSAPMLKYDFGQPLDGAYHFPTANGTDGTLTMDFTTRTTGLLTLPGGRQVSIQRENFGVGDPPKALLGAWLYAYAIGNVTFADAYVLTTVISATTTGNGVVTNAAHDVGFEYQVSGTFAGQVIGAQFTSTGTILNQYLYTPQLEEGRGSWISPTSQTKYGMNVYKLATASGVGKSKEQVGDPVIEKGIAPQQPRGISIDELAATQPELAAIIRAQWELLSGMR